MPRSRVKLKDLKAQAKATLAKADKEMDDGGKLFAMLIKEVLDGVTISIVNQDTKKKFRYSLNIELLEGDEGK